MRPTVPRLELLAMKAHSFKILVSVCHGQKFRLKKTKYLICIFFVEFVVICFVISVLSVILFVIVLSFEFWSVILLVMFLTFLCHFEKL
jgi:hypothetical protein